MAMARFKNFRSWQGPLKKFKRWYENSIHNIFKEYDDIPDSTLGKFGAKFVDVSFRLTLHFLASVMYILLRLGESFYELLFQAKVRKFFYMYGALATSFVPAVRGFFYSIGFHLGLPPASIMPLIVIGIVVGYQINELAAWITMASILSLTIVNFIGAWFVAAKDRAMKDNLEKHGTSNPQKHGYENTQTPFSDIPLLPMDEESKLKIVAKRVHSMVKLGALEANYENLERTEFIPVNHTEESVAHEDEQQVELETLVNVDTLAIIKAVNEGSATSTQKWTLLSFYYHRLESTRAENESRPGFTFSDKLTNIDGKEIDRLQGLYPYT